MVLIIDEFEYDKNSTLKESPLVLLNLCKIHNNLNGV